MRLSRRFIEDLLLIGRAGPRLLHESAVQIDVWASFGKDPGKAQDLLLTPWDHLRAARLAARLNEITFGLGDVPGSWTAHCGGPPPGERPPGGIRLFPLEGFVAIRADLHLFLDVLLPFTEANLQAGYEELHGLVVAWMHDPGRHGEGTSLAGLEPTLPLFLRFAATHRTHLAPDLRLTLLYMLLVVPELEVEMGGALISTGVANSVEELADLLVDRNIAAARPGALPCDERLIWQIARNRRVEMMGTSVETVKADAARRLFVASARRLTWAVIDSGIDNAHPAFRDHDAGGFATRVRKTYDFSRLRDLASYDGLPDPATEAFVRERLLAAGLPEDQHADWIERLREDARKGRPFDWGMLERLLETPDAKVAAVGGDGKPVGHGTHVAGVLAGDWRENDAVVYQGVAPDLQLYDLRILGDGAEDTEFAVIAALEFIRWLNARNRFLTIHGVNLSIGLEHDVRNFACGQTPVCRACDATVRAGVVVVAAAGNWGHQNYATESGDIYRGYAAASIADPGNTESVITVGATHRDRPHEYGVSFFSSRGPTGDGRRKPDLVAPGEKIEGPLPDLGLGTLDGTSMAAPHVSGVAALVLARHPELVGKPMVVKQVLVESATDLGRERDFQGAGLVDALRALQSR